MKVIDKILYYAAFYALLIAMITTTIAISHPKMQHAQGIGFLLLLAIIAILILLPKPSLPVREPMYMGSGIHMHEQFQANKLVKGDKCWDTDWGYLEWNGKEWLQSDG